MLSQHWVILVFTGNIKYYIIRPRLTCSYLYTWYTRHCFRGLIYIWRRCWPNAGLMLGQCLRRWPNIKLASDQRREFGVVWAFSIIAYINIIAYSSNTKYFPQFEIIEAPFSTNNRIYIAVLISFRVSCNMNKDEKPYHYAPVKVEK